MMESFIIYVKQSRWGSFGKIKESRWGRKIKQSSCGCLGKIIL